MLQSIYFTNKYCTFLYSKTNTDVADYKFILFYGMKLSKEVCVNHTEHEPVLLTAEENCSCLIAHQINKLLNMQRCGFYFCVSILGVYLIER